MLLHRRIPVVRRRRRAWVRPPGAARVVSLRLAENGERRVSGVVGTLFPHTCAAAQIHKVRAEHLGRHMPLASRPVVKTSFREQPAALQLYPGPPAPIAHP